MQCEMQNLPGSDQREARRLVRQIYDGRPRLRPSVGRCNQCYGNKWNCSYVPHTQSDELQHQIVEPNIGISAGRHAAEVIDPGMVERPGG